MKSTAAALILGFVAPFVADQRTMIRAQRSPAGTALVDVRTFPLQIPEYDAARENNDRHLARIFGGLNAVAAGNGFEPRDVWNNGIRQYRGDPNGTGHLDRALHLYGSEDGNSYTELYIPPGFKYLGPMTSANGIENGGHTFFYRQLGTQRDVYLLVFHVKDFKIDRSDRNEAKSIRIGNIGGPGGGPVDPDRPPTRNGKVSRYLHSHLTIQKSPKSSAKKIPFFDAFPTPT